MTAAEPLMSALGLPEDDDRQALMLVQTFEQQLSLCMRDQGFEYVPVTWANEEDDLRNVEYYNGLSLEQRRTYDAAMYGNASEYGRELDNGGCYETANVLTYPNQGLADEWGYAVDVAGSCSRAWTAECARFPGEFRSALGTTTAVELVFVTLYKDMFRPFVQRIEQAT